MARMAGIRREEVKVMAHVGTASRGFERDRRSARHDSSGRRWGRPPRGPVVLRNIAGGMRAMGVIYGIGSLIGQVTG